MQADICGISDTVWKEGIMNSTEGMISYRAVVDMKILIVERMKKTKTVQNSGKDGDWWEGEHGRQEMWEVFKNKGRSVIGR